MSEAFDPYLHWLGIRDPQRPPNYYRLLGVELFESDPVVLTNAADRQMAHVRTFQTGPRSAESQRILNELAAAKVCLLNPEKKAAYDARLRQELGLAAAGLPGAPPIVAAAGGAAAETSDWSFIRQELPRRPAARPFMPAVWLLVAVLAAMAVVLAGLIVFVLTTGPGVAVPRATEPAGPLAQGEPAGGISGGEAVPKKSAKPADTSAGKSGAESAGKPGAESVGPSLPQPSAGAKNGGRPSTAATAAKKPPVGPAGKTPKEPGSPLPAELPSPAALPSPEVPSLPRVASKPSSTMPGEPATAPLPEPIPPVANSLAAAREALRARDTGKALAHLELAEKAAQPSEKPEVDRLRMATGLLDVYWRTVRVRLAQLKPGERIAYAGQPATVVAATEESLVLDRGGQTMTLALAALPREVVEPLAEAGLPADVPGSLLARAAFELFDAAGDRQKAVVWLRKAAAAGQPVELLAQELPPGVIPAPAAKPAGGRLPRPEPAASEAALKKVREVFKEQYAAAQTPAEKRALGQALLRQAVETRDDPAVRFVLLSEAQAAAVAAGDGALLRQSVGQLARDYEIEETEELVRVLSAAADTPLPAAVRHALAKTALEAGREALRADDFDHARRLAKTAQLLASKARDAATARQAGDLSATIPWLKQEFDKAQQAAQRLAQDPDHPQANLALGVYTALVKDDWKRGLPLLAKGSDPRLRSLAEAELALEAAPAVPEMIKLGDQWRAAIKAVEAPLQGAVARRALFWYERALPNVTGFNKTYLEQRIAALKEIEASRRRP